MGTSKCVPATAFVNDIRADLFDPQTVYAALDNHKYGDFKPYLIVSHDLGRSWKLISQGLPEKLLVWRIVQDHIKKELLFAATEFGIYFTIDAGMHWNALKGGLPTIAFRDIAIQRRENDLVGASFGRGFFVLDDYSPLRTLTKNNLEKVISEMAGKEYSLLKTKLAEVLISEITPIGKEIKKLLADKSHLKNILKKGSEKANIIAEENLKNIREKVGLI